MSDPTSPVPSDVLPVAAGNGTSAQHLVVRLVQVFSLAAGVHLMGQDLRLLLALPVVCLLADFLSGVVHWFFDTQVDPGRTPLGGIAIDFQDHHVHPLRTLEVGFIPSAIRPALLVTLPLVGISVLMVDQPWAQSFCFWIGVVSMYVPQAHKMAHDRSPPRLTRVAQSLRLILPRRAHIAHHKDNGRAYCVFTGWLNPLLDGVGFWRKLERVIPGARPYA